MSVLYRRVITAVASAGLVLTIGCGKKSPTAPDVPALSISPAAATTTPGGTAMFQATSAVNCTATGGAVEVNGGVNIKFTAPMNTGTFDINCTGSAGSTKASVQVQPVDQAESYTNNTVVYIPNVNGKVAVQPGAFKVVPSAFNPARDSSYSGGSLGWQAAVTVACETPNPDGGGFSFYTSWVDGAGNPITSPQLYGGGYGPVQPCGSLTINDTGYPYRADLLAGKTVAGVMITIKSVSATGKNWLENADHSGAALGPVRWNARF